MVKPVPPGIRVASVLLLGIPGIAVPTYAGTELVIATDAHSRLTPAWGAFFGGAVLALAGFGFVSRCMQLASSHSPFSSFAIELQQSGSWVAWLIHPAIIIWPIVTYQWCKGYYG